MRELYNLGALRSALIDARKYTLALYAHLTPNQLRFPYLSSINPPWWELAHVGWFQEHWCLRWRDGEPLPAPRLAGADPILNSALIPHADRWDLPQLTPEIVHGYLERELHDTLDALESAPRERLYFYMLSLLHEDMHGEALLMTLQTLGYPAPQFGRVPLPRPTASAPPVDREVPFAGGRFLLGAVPGRDFVFDNEKWAHEVEVAPFALAAIPVTTAQFAAFVEADGYADERLWLPEGWRWRNQTRATQPRYWRRESGGWVVRRFDQWEELADDEPVVHVNAHEADAYCRFAGRRLPTEAEWEFAARCGLPAGADRYPWGDAPLPDGLVNLGGAYGRPLPATSLPTADSPMQLHQMLGNVWEWTSSPFGPYPDFAPDPYKEYSQPWFGDHQVLRGGCFATRARLVHNRWRNFYRPERNDIFAGLRTARSL